MEIWRRYWLDAALLLLAGAIATSTLAGIRTGTALASTLSSVIGLLLFLARRWQPLTVSLLSFAALAFGASLEVDVSPSQFFGILITFGLVGALNRPRDAVLAWTAGELTLAYAISRDAPGTRLADLALTSAFCTTIWAAGLAVAERARHASEAEQRAETAERTQAEHARRAIKQERARIATELHDIVSHGLSVVIVQTVAARQALTGPDLHDVDRRLGAVEETARDALSDMRRMLGLLQLTTDGAASTDPSPGLANVPALLERARAAGITLRARGFDHLPALGAGLELTVYRVVQESLTNVIRHAPSASVEVGLVYLKDRLDIVVGNEAPPTPAPVRTGSGRGLMGLRQRCAVYGGYCAAGPTPDGGFEVRVSLPLMAHSVLTETS